MPTGLLLVNATGAIGSSNPAAEEALGVKSLRYRSYKEVLGADSGLAHMLEACLREGKTFHRGEVEHTYQRGRSPPSGRHDISYIPRRSQRRSLKGRIVIFSRRG